MLALPLSLRGRHPLTDHPHCGAMQLNLGACSHSHHHRRKTKNTAGFATTHMQRVQCHGKKQSSCQQQASEGMEYVHQRHSGLRIFLHDQACVALDTSHTKNRLWSCLGCIAAFHNVGGSHVGACSTCKSHMSTSAGPSGLRSSPVGCSSIWLSSASRTCSENGGMC